MVYYHYHKVRPFCALNQTKFMHNIKFNNWFMVGMNTSIYLVMFLLIFVFSCVNADKTY